MVIAQAYQGGLGLPDRDYYTKEDDGSKKLRDQYVEHVGKMLTLLGDPAAKASEGAKKMLAIETSLAKPARTRVELRNPEKNYNKMSQADLQKLMPDLNWADYFKAINLTEPGDINVGQPDFFKAANGVFASTLDRRLEDVSALAPGEGHGLGALERFREREFRFFGQTLTGAKKLKERWKRVVESTDGVGRRSARQTLCGRQFPAGIEGAHDRAGEERAGGDGRQHQVARLDGRARRSRKR